jgi:ankyrin repeat protein
MLLESRVDVNARDEIFGRTALHMASKGGHDQTVQILLENEVDTDVRDEVTP